MSNYTDLDAFVGEPRTVRLRGREYLLPNQLPMETFLRIVALGEQEEQAEDGDLTAAGRRINSMLLIVVELFTLEHDLTPNGEETLRHDLGRLSVPQMASLINTIYRSDIETGDEVDDDVGPTPSNGTTKDPTFRTRTITAEAQTAL